MSTRQSQKGKNVRPNSNLIKNRLSTIRYEISKSLTQGPTIPAVNVEQRKTILALDGICEYCRINKARTLDHLNPLIQKGYPSSYCGDEWNMIPACSSCNSSKGCSTIIEWLSSKAKQNPCLHLETSEKQATLEKWKLYEKLCDENCVRRSVNQDAIKDVYDLTNRFLDILQTIVNEFRDDLLIDDRMIRYGSRIGPHIQTKVEQILRNLSDSTSTDIEDLTKLVQVSLKVVKQD